MAKVVSQLQVYPAAFPGEYEEELSKVDGDVDQAMGTSKAERVWGEYQFDGTRYQCQILVADETYMALSETFPEAY